MGENLFSALHPERGVGGCYFWSEQPALNTGIDLSNIECNTSGEATQIINAEDDGCNGVRDAVEAVEMHSGHPEAHNPDSGCLQTSILGQKKASRRVPYGAYWTEILADPRACPWVSGFHRSCSHIVRPDLSHTSGLSRRTEQLKQQVLAFMHKVRQLTWTPS